METLQKRYNSTILYNILFVILLSSLFSSYLNSQTPPGVKGFKKEAEYVVPLNTGKIGFHFKDQWALIIGIDKYDNVRDLNFAVKETRKLKTLLIEKYGFKDVKKKHNYPYSKVEYISNEKATKESIMERLDWYKKNLEPMDSIFIYFSGHGYVDQGEMGYWIPGDAGNDLAARNTLTDEEIMERSRIKIANNKILEFLKVCKAKHILVAIDSCYAGAGQTFSVLKGTPPIQLIRRKSRQLIAAHTGTIPDPSPFSGYFIETLEDNRKSFLTASSLMSSVKEKLGDRFAPPMGFVPGTGNNNGEFIFVLPSPVSVYFFNKGCDYDEKREYTRALESYREAVEIYPQNVKAHINMGIVYLYYKRYEDALNSFKTAIRLEPESPGAYYNAGILYNRLENYPKAIEMNNRAIQRNPNYGAAYNNMGYAYAKRGKYPEAIKAFTKALQLNPGDVTIIRNLAEIHQRLGNTEEADKYEKRGKNPGGKQK